MLNLGGQAQQAQQGTKFRKPKPDKSRKPKPDKPRKPAGGPNANNADPGRSRRGPGQSRVQPGQSSISLAVDTVSRLEGRCIKCGSKAHFVKACDASNAQCTKWTTVDGPAAFKKMFAFKAVADSGAAGQTSQQQGGSAGAVEQDMSTVTGQAAALQDALSSLSVSQAPPPDPEPSPRTTPPSPPPSPPSRENVDPDDCADAPERSESTKPADARLSASGRGESTGFAHAAHVGEGGQSSEPTDPDAPDRDGPIEMEESVCNHWAEGVMMSLEAWAAGASPADLQQLLAPTTPKFPRVEVMIPDPQPRAVECGCWTVRMDAPISMGEAFEHRRQLYLYVNQDNEDNNDPVNQKWHTGSTAHLGALPNTARVRLPTGPRWGSAMDVSETAYDLAQAYARMQTGDFDVLVIPQSLQSLERGHTRIKELLDSLVTDRASDEGPGFTRSYDHDELVQEHHARLQTPRRAISFLSVMCGVSGEGLAVQACGADPDKMTFLEICPLNCQILRRRYPRAVIINGDVRDPTAQALVVKYAGDVDMMMVAELCQPSSLASKTHDPNDERLATGIAAVQLVALVSPASLVVENVASFKSKQAATFHKVVALIGKHFDQVIIMHSNANECMTCTKRARVWMMGCASEVDLGPMRDFCGRQKRMRVEGALKTAPSVRAELLQHRPDVAGKLGVVIPHLRGAKHGKDGRPRRIIDIGGGYETITTKYAVALNDKWLRRYKGCESDFARPEQSICSNTQQFGVLQGFSITSPWSHEALCRCGGCIGKGGRTKAQPAATQIGNAIVPAQAFAWAKHFVRALAHHLDASEDDAESICEKATALICGMASRLAADISHAVCKAAGGELHQDSPTGLASEDPKPQTYLLDFDGLRSLHEEYIAGGSKLPPRSRAVLQAMRRDHAKKRENGRPMHEAIMGKLNNDPDFLEHGFAVLDDPYGRDVGPDVKQLVLWAANHIGWERLQANAVRYLKALELDLGDLGSESVVVWQNREKHRSIPQIPHCHVYIKTRPQPHFKRPQPRASQGAAPSEGPTPRGPRPHHQGVR